MRLPALLGISALVGAFVACAVQQAGAGAAAPIEGPAPHPDQVRSASPALAGQPGTTAMTLRPKSPAEPAPWKADPDPRQPGEATSTDGALPI